MRHWLRASALSILFLVIGWALAPAAGADSIALRGRSPAGADAGILYLGVEPSEWQALAELLEDYFDRLAADGYSEDSCAALAAALSDRHRVQLADVSPAGYYDAWQDRVYADKRLFCGLANRVYVLSVIHHEKIHQNQCRRLDSLFLREDQVRRYPEKLQEICAHYGQIKWVLGTGDRSALAAVLANSCRLGMFPGLLRTYRADDPVLRAVRRFTDAETP